MIISDYDSPINNNEVLKHGCFGLNLYRRLKLASKITPINLQVFFKTHIEGFVELL